MSAASRVIDMELALERAGGSSDLARDLFQMLLAELPGFLQRIRDAYAIGDLANLQVAVHKLNGATLYCGVPELTAAAHDLEVRMKRGETRDLNDLVARLVRSIEQVMGAPFPEVA